MKSRYGLDFKKAIAIGGVGEASKQETHLMLGQSVQEFSIP